LAAPFPAPNCNPAMASGWSFGRDPPGNFRRVSLVRVLLCGDSLVGIDLLFKGWSCLMFALASRTACRHQDKIERIIPLFWQQPWRQWTAQDNDTGETRHGSAGTPTGVACGSLAGSAGRKPYKKTANGKQHLIRSGALTGPEQEPWLRQRSGVVSGE